MDNILFHSREGVSPSLLWRSAALLLLLAYVLHLGLHPLVLEEPRRAIITLEMLANDNPWAPTFLGEWYYKKPPVYNWVLLLSAWIGGGPSEWAFRLPTVLSIAGIAGLLLLAGRRYHSLEMGVLSALLFAVSIDVLFYFSILAEIDLFYAFVSFAGILSVFHFYQQQQYYLLFVAAYGLGAVGFLTKGLPSIPFTGITIGVYLLYKRQWSLLFSPAHLAGLLLFATLVGGYYYQYSRYAPLPPLLGELFSESGDRTIVATGLGAFGIHALLFPLDTLKILLPASLLLLYLPPLRVLREQLLRQEYVAFALLVFLANYLLYWVSPGSRQRYIYPILPLAMVPLVFFYLENRLQRKWADAVLGWVTVVLIGVLGAAGLALPFFSLFDGIGGRIPLAVGSLLFSSWLYTLWRQRRQRSLLLLILVLAGARLLFSAVFLPLRAADERDLHNKQSAELLHQAAVEEPIYLLGNTELPKTTIYYLDALRPQRPLTRQASMDRPGRYLTDKTGLDSSRQEVGLELFFDDKPLWLVRPN